MLKKYKPFFRAGAMDRLAFKFNLFTWVFVTVFEVACILFLWIAVYKNSPNGLDSVINGYTFKEMICYLVMINIFTFVVFSSDTMWQIKEEIKDGTIAMAFIKPISYRARFIFTNLGNVFMQILLIGLPCFSIAYIVFICIGYIQIASIWIFLLHLILFVIALLFSTLLNDVIDYIFGILCFYTSSGWGLSQIKNVIIGFFAGTLLPLSFFPGIFGEIIEYFPFAGMAQNPVLILLMKVDPIESLKLIGLSCIWLILLECFAALLFKHASKKVTVQGG